MDKTLQQMSAPRWPRIAIISTLLLLSLPIVLGFGATLAAAFDYAPALGRNVPSLEPFIALFQTPGFWRSLALSIWTGLASTIFALSFAIAIVAQGKPAPKLIAPLLATPHAAIGLGLGFMIAPTGVIVRLLFAPFGIEIPPQITTVNDPIGLAIILALIIKELPFLIFVLYAARDQIPMREHQAIARSMGYHPVTSFIRVALPQLYPLIRLPVLAVLGFAIGVVDIAIILGPSTPPTLAVSAVRWFNNPDLNFLFVASASAVVIAAITTATLGLALIAEKLVLRFVLRRAQSGDRRAVLWPWYLLQNVGRATLILGASGIFLTMVWSFSFRWPFPYILPTEWSLRVWQLNGKGLFGAASMTLLVATSATAIAFVFTVLWLEAETYFRRLHLG